MPGLRRCCDLLLLLPPQGGELTVRHQGQQRSYFRGGSPSAASKCSFAAFYAGEQRRFEEGFGAVLKGRRSRSFTAFFASAPGWGGQMARQGAL